MGRENMRRWPIYLVLAICILLTLSLFNSWGIERDLQSKISEISRQLQQCSRQHTNCREESLAIIEQKDGYIKDMKDLEEKRDMLNEAIQVHEKRYKRIESQVNRTLVDVEICKTELNSLKNLQVSKSAVLDTLRLEKETLSSQIEEKNERIKELEAKVEKLETTLKSKQIVSTKSAPNPPIPIKVSQQPEPDPAQAPNLAPPLDINANNVLNEPVLENDAKEDVDDTNIVDNDPIDPNDVNDPNDFDAQLQ